MSTLATVARDATAPPLPAIDVVTTIDEYLDRSDWRVNANANQGYSLGGLILNTAGKVIANYWLSEIYPPEVGEAHRAGDLHVHDLDMLAGYCAGWSLRVLLEEGLNGVSGKIDSRPPRHFSSAVGQIVNFLGTMQNEWAGAQAFSSFDTYMSPFVRIDSLTYAEVRQHIQELVYNLNVPSRWGTQTPFTNLTFDWVCPDDLREQVPVIGGVAQDFCYGDLAQEMALINATPTTVTSGGRVGRLSACRSSSCSSSATRVARGSGSGTGAGPAGGTAASSSTAWATVARPRGRKRPSV
ncbi:MAG: hypothetical protein B7Y93_01025 [Micrococcales bacterium 32-70-13]|nr:MAG: hypothetical protein B7Y93_01025 [Micrococcales bacterium 32-70-13]